MTRNIKQMPRASLLSDGSRVELEFEDDAGERVTLNFETNDFERFVSRAVQVVTGARSQKLSIGDHLAIHTIRAVEAAAEAPIGGGGIALLIRADNGLPYLFGLPPAVAKSLRPTLNAAIKKEAQQAKQSRH